MNEIVISADCHLDLLAEDNVMWGSDFPHPDGVWPDSKEFLARETAGLSDAIRRKLVSGNAARVYGFDVDAMRREALNSAA